MSLDLRDRCRTYRRLESEDYDLLVIGGGITGCGIARDATLRGFRVALVEAQDLASGTSSRSSKLIHGGLPYLLAGHIRLVKEAANERRTLRRIAPHLTIRNEVVIPVVKKARQWEISVGLSVYERIGRVAREERHQLWDIDELQKREPAVALPGCRGALVYSEFLTDDAKLTIANARDAFDRGGTIATYSRAERLLESDGKVSGALVRSTLAGDQREARVRARIVINAAGPWVDRIRSLERDFSRAKLCLARGIHLILRRERVNISRPIVMASTDGRTVFAVPRGAYVYLGTTDKVAEEPTYAPSCSKEEVEYLLRSATDTFSGGPFAQDDVLGGWAGLRPLVKEPGKKSHEIKRKHEIEWGAGGMLTVSGGKLTNYRLIAGRAVDACEMKLRGEVSGSRTGEEPLPGSKYCGELAQLHSVLTETMSDESAERVRLLYGWDALQMFQGEPTVLREVEHAVRVEGALTLEDYWTRRSARSWFPPGGSSQRLDEAAEAMAKELNWNDSEKKRQLESCINCSMLRVE